MRYDRAIFAGSFDPFHNGHLSVAMEAARIFKTVVVKVMNNPAKQHRFDIGQRFAMVKAAVEGNDCGIIAEIDAYGTLAACAKYGDAAIVRGIRNGKDIEPELELNSITRLYYPDVLTVLIPCEPEYAYLSSTIVRGLWDASLDVTPVAPWLVGVIGQ